MKTELKFDFRELSRGVADLEAKSHQILLKSANDIGLLFAGKAKDNAPVDEGNLTQDIKHEVSEQGGKVVVYCFVSSNAPSASYAIKIHEEEYNLGVNSLAKANLGYAVGNKYIARSMTENQDKFGKIIEFNYKKNLK